MNQTFPDHVPAAELIGDSPAPGIREVRLVFISTLNGSASIGGDTSAMGNATDSELFHGMRQWSDAILVGANTVRREGYGPVAHGTTEQLAARRSAGQSPVPALAVISRSLDFPGDTPLLAAGGPALILTPQASLDDHPLAERRARLERAGLELVSTGRGTPAEILSALTSRGMLRIDCEGGPGIAAMMLHGGLIDVLNLTYQPTLAAPVEQPLLSLRPDMGTLAQEFFLEHVAPTSDGYVFLRYRRATTG